MRTFRQEYLGEFVMKPEEVAMSRTRPFPEDKVVMRSVLPRDADSARTLEMMRMAERPCDTSEIRW